MRIFHNIYIIDNKTVKKKSTDRFVSTEGLHGLAGVGAQAGFDDHEEAPGHPGSAEETAESEEKAAHIHFQPLHSGQEGRTGKRRQQGN